LAPKWAGLVGKGASDGGSVDVDCRDDALYSCYTHPEIVSEDEGPVDFGADLPPELQEALEAHLTSHYRQTQDGAIPMLNGKTPRECAADPASQDEVIGWLNYMENSDKRSPGPSYDFTWMRDALNRGARLTC
jgi:hypothetical protein